MTTPTYGEHDETEPLPSSQGVWGRSHYEQTNDETYEHELETDDVYEDEVETVEPKWPHTPPEESNLGGCNL